MARVRGICLPFPTALLALYPAAMWCLVWLGGQDDISAHLPPSISSSLKLNSLRILGLSFTEALRLGVASVLILNAYSALCTSREYQTEDSSGEVAFLHKWDFSDARLSLLCLASPLHVPLVILRGWLGFVGGADEASIVFVAVLHGYCNLLLAHRFLQRESIEAALFRGVYGVEVEYRDREMRRRRECERTVFEELDLWKNQKGPSKGSFG